jgi:hypothetical protein
MARLAVAVTAIALALAPEIAAAQAVGAPPIPTTSIPATPMPRPMPPLPAPPPVPMTAPMAAMGAPTPVVGSYVAPSYGYTLPGQWMAPQHFIGSYWTYGLPAPAPGFGWSRYYDDYVLTDRWGRVYDWRDARDYRGGRWRDGRRNKDRSGIVGALIGGAVGAVTGNLIAGAGSRLAGSLIGGGLGALAGQAIDKSTHGDRGYGHGYGYGYRPRGPHWGGDYAATCNCGETVTTTTVTYPEQVTERKVTYVTEYVRGPRTRAKHTPRGKYVRVN